MNKPSYKIQSGQILMSGTPVELPYPVVETVLFDDLLIVRVEAPIGMIFNRNVFAVAADGRRKWQIQESPHGMVSDKPYVRISLDSTGSLVAANWIGIDYYVDPKDGAIVTKAFNK